MLISGRWDVVLQLLLFCISRSGVLQGVGVCSSVGFVLASAYQRDAAHPKQQMSTCDGYKRYTRNTVALT